MQYTVQQLQGGPKYNHKTRIGNWNEDMELSTVQQNNYQGKKTAGELPFAKTISKYQQSYKQVPWSHSNDGNLRWNDNVMIQNAQTQGWVVMDIGTRVPNVDEGYTVTSTGVGQNPGPMTRSVFKIARVDDCDIFGSDCYVRYGQKVRIQANEYLFRKQLGLTSMKHSPTICAPLSGNQISFMSAARADANGVWVIDSVEPNTRFECQGEIIKAGEPVLIRHVPTCVYLASCDKLKTKNDFGAENEVHCFNHQTNNKSQNLALEKDGRVTVDVPTKYVQSQNCFLIHTAPDASYARPIAELAKFDVVDLLKDVKSKIFAKSSFGIRGLKRIFSAMDANGNCKLECDDFRWGLMDFGIQVSPEEAQEILNHFDTDKNGVVDFQEFLRCLKGELNERRLACVQKAYSCLDVNGDGQVKLDDIAKLYDASGHPEVQSGYKTERDLFMEFMSLWDTQEKDGIVTFDEFCQYYSDISASVETDDEFDAIMQNAWKY